jgi:hypothetical protein
MNWSMIVGIWIGIIIGLVLYAMKRFGGYQ